MSTEEKICSNCRFWHWMERGGFTKDIAGGISIHTRRGNCSNGAMNGCVNMYRSHEEFSEAINQLEKEFFKDVEDACQTGKCVKWMPEKYWKWDTSEDFGCVFFENKPTTQTP